MSQVDCRIHGAGTGAIVCRHMLESTEAVGFIENSSDPGDLQAWCHSCELLYEKEQGLTDAFRDFNGFAVVCVDCYVGLKRRHDRTA